MNKIQELDAYVKSRVTSLTVYRKEQPLEVFTGTFLSWNGRFFVLTAAHCLERFQNRRAEGEGVVIQAVLRAGNRSCTEVSTEGYERYIIRNRLDHVAIEDGVESWYDFHDLALLEIPPASVEAATRYRAFVSQEAFSEATSAQDVLLTGYRSRDQSADGNHKSLHIKSFTFETTVEAKSARLIQLKYDPAAHEELAQEPFGISGAGAYGDTGQFIGMVWGGCMKRRRLWVCPAPLIEAFLGRHL